MMPSCHSRRPTGGQTARSFANLVVALTLSASLTGCALLHVPQQQQRLDAACRIQGTAKIVASGTKGPNAIVVVLLRKTDASGGDAFKWKIVDHFVMDHAGSWAFATGEGTYRVAAFEDSNSDLVYEPGEPFTATSSMRQITCSAGARIRDVDISVDANSTDRLDGELDVASLQALSLDDKAERSLGQLTAVGEITTLADSRFDLSESSNGLWRPYDYMHASPPGIYFLEPYDPHRIPVLFVHGILGSPANFATLISRLDRTRFQAWVYNYPSGLPLASLADHLNQTVEKIQLRFHVRRLAVVAHSMGGLISRGFILRHATTSDSGDIPLFVSMATPWEGHDGAILGVKYSPVVVPVWRDMAPGSDYLRSLFDVSLPRETQFHLLFAFRRNSASFGESDDETVTVSSALGTAAQRDAARIYGFDDTHDSILEDPATSALLQSLLAATFPGKKATP
jgi:pimeloyl-ACP methyl ester carboxylesterase